MLSQSLKHAAKAFLLLSSSARVSSASISNDTGVTVTGYPPCDALIAANLSHLLLFPSSPLYEPQAASFWALNTRLQPWCFALPRSTSDVSAILSTLSSIPAQGVDNWHIAIRSGGHMNNVGYNNVAQGVTIDLSNMNGTSYDSATGIAGLQPGGRWRNVYTELLERDGVSVTGGRDGGVGVGGFLLGGGNSYYTGRTGFGCDNVVGYEVVLSSGEILYASATQHADLWRALKGGSSNFGIVTRFDMDAFEARDLARGTRVMGKEFSDEFADAIVRFTARGEESRDNAMIQLVRYDPAAGGIIMLAIKINTAGHVNSTAFEDFDRIPALSNATEGMLALESHAAAANDSQLAGGSRNTAYSVTFGNDARVVRYAIEEHASYVAELIASIGPNNFSTQVIFQPIPSYFADIGVQKGRNMLGLERTSGDRILFVWGISLLNKDSEVQYALIREQTAAVTQKIVAYAKSIGSSHEFVYMNYADASQDPIGTYSAENIAHIRRVASKYNPDAFFQRRVPGGFKVARAG